jgi:hypothetical protein
VADTDGGGRIFQDCGDFRIFLLKMPLQPAKSARILRSGEIPDFSTRPIRKAAYFGGRAAADRAFRRSSAVISPNLTNQS